MQYDRRPRAASMQHSHEALDRAGGRRARRAARRRCATATSACCGSAMCVSLLGDGAFLVALAWQVYALTDDADGDVAGRHRDDGPDDRLPAGRRRRERPLRPPPPDARRRPRASASPRRCSAVLALTGALELWHIVVHRGRLRHRGGVLRARRSTRSCPSCCPASGSRRPTRSTSSCGRSRCGWPAPRSAASLVGAWRERGPCSRSTRASFLISAGALLMHADAAATRGADRRIAPLRGTCARAGATCARAPGCGRRSRARPSPTCCFMGPVEVLRPATRQARPRRHRGRPRPRLRRRRARLGGLRDRDGPARAAAPLHHVHVRRLDRRDARGRRLRARRPRSGS